MDEGKFFSVFIEDEWCIYQLYNVYMLTYFSSMQYKMVSLVISDQPFRRMRSDKGLINEMVLGFQKSLLPPIARAY